MTDPDRTAEPGRLSDAEASRFASELAAAPRSGLPLDGLLLACAEEAPRGRLAEAFRALAGDVTAGKPLESALQERRDGFGRPLATILAVSARGGRVASMLDQWLKQQRKEVDLRRHVMTSLIYPLFLTALMAVVFAFCVGNVGSKLDSLSHAVGDWSFVRLGAQDSLLTGTPAYGFSACVLFVVAMLFASLAWPRVGWISRVIEAIPLVGSIWHWRRQSRFAAMMATLLDAEIPLAEALELAAESAGSGRLRRACRAAAKEVAGGSPLSASLASHDAFAASLVPLVQWGERQSTLGAALRATAELFEARAMGQASLLRSIAPPIAFLGILGGVFACFASLYASLETAIPQFSFMFMDTPAPPVSRRELVGLSAMALGAASLIAMGLFARRNAAGSRGGIRIGLQVIAWGCVLCGFFALTLSQAGGLSPLLLGTAIVVGFEVLAKRRRSQQYALLDLLTVSVERGVSPIDVIKAFARETRGKMGRRAEKFAVALQQGMTWEDAMQSIPRLFPREAIPMLCLGERSGGFVQSLCRESQQRSDAADVLDMLWTRVIYICLIGQFAIAAMVFVGHKTLCCMQKIFRDFDMTLPGPADVCLRFFGYDSGVQGILALLMLFSMVVLFYALARQARWIAWDLPGTGWILRRLDVSSVLDGLALAVQQHMPITEAMESLALNYPKPSIRHCLVRAFFAARQGRPWEECLAEQRLLSATELAVVRAAGRVANLSWALRALAESGRRRFVRRLGTIEQTLMPLMVLGVALGVAVVVAAVVFPLIVLIERLV